jgi:hypothetical protein
MLHLHHESADLSSQIGAYLLHRDSRDAEKRIMSGVKS